MNPAISYKSDHLLENEEPMDKFCVFDDATKSLIERHLSDLTVTQTELEIPEAIDEKICICSLPDEKLFCFGTCLHWSDIKGTAFIVDKNHNVQELPPGYPNLGSAATYTDGSIYAFGGSNGLGKLKLAEKFNLSKNKGEKLPNMPYTASLLSCTAFNGAILITGFHAGKSLEFDLFSYSYSELPLVLSQLYGKVICKFNQRAYILALSGNVYESGILDQYNWNCVSNFPAIDGLLSSNKVFYQDCLYFSVLSSQVFKLDLAKKEVKQIVWPLQ